MGEGDPSESGKGKGEGWLLFMRYTKRKVTSFEGRKK